MKREYTKQGKQKTRMQQIAEVVGRSWLDSWPGTMQEEAGDQPEIAKANEMMTGMTKDKEREELHL